MSKIIENYLNGAETIKIKAAEELGISGKPEKAEKILKAVLHAIRNRLNREDNFRFMTLLPSELTALYAQNWNLPKRDPKPLLDQEDLIREIQKTTRQVGLPLFQNDQEVLKAFSCALKLIRNQTSLRKRWFNPVSDLPIPNTFPDWLPLSQTRQIQEV